MIFTSNFDIFLLTLSCEELPLTLSEALADKISVMAIGTVGVASKVIQNNCGIIVKPRTDQALAERSYN